MNIKEKDQAYIANTYARFNIEMERGAGALVYDTQGKSYIDFTSGIGVNIFGYCDEGWVKAVDAQLHTLSHVSNLYYSAPDVQVAENFCQRTGCKKVFFGNSGAEANEGAIKTARKYSHDKYGEGRYEIITLVNSFHGRTMATLSATGQDGFHQHFMPFVDGFTYALANDKNDLLKKVSAKTCAIMMEMVQGEGGVIALDPSFVRMVADYCKEHDVLLIIDEVQTGIGRCGSFFAYEQYEIQPDIVTSAKGLGGGLPIGAVLLYDKVKDTLQPGDHGTTFGGNPIACAGANYILNKCDASFLSEVKKKGTYLQEKLAGLPHVIEVSGLGMMIGVSFDHMSGKEVVDACIQKGAIFLTAKQKLRLLPPLTISYEQIDHGLAILEEVLTNWEETK